MTTTIALPERLAEQLQQRATVEHRSVESLAIECIVAGLTETDAAIADHHRQPLDDPELLTLVARIKAMPPNPASIIPARGNLADVLRMMEAIEDETYDVAAEIAALQAAEQELRDINRADDIAEGRG